MSLEVDNTINVIDALYPDFTEYQDNGDFFHWMDYACELDEIKNQAYIDNSQLIDYINQRIAKHRSGSGQHDAAVDVGSTLEESYPTIYKGVFNYD